MHPIEVVGMEAEAATVVAVAVAAATHCWSGPAYCLAAVQVFVTSAHRHVGCRDQLDVSCSTWQSIHSSEAHFLLAPVERSQPQAGVERSQHGQPHALCRGS